MLQAFSRTYFGFATICLIALFLFWGNANRLSAQRIVLETQPADSNWVDGLPSSFSNKNELDTFLRDWRLEQFASAHWEASVDSLVAIDTFHYRAYLHRGPQYQWGALKVSADIPARWLSKAGFRPRLFRNRPLNHSDWLSLRDSLAARAADNGYPFAVVKLDNIEWERDRILNADIVIEKDSLLRFGKLRIPESARINKVFLERYLGIAENMPFSRTVLKRIPARLARLPYLKQTGDPTIEFQNNFAILDLPLTRKPASKFDFVIGVLPNNSETGKLLITGELNGELQNGLGQGERIAVKFQQLRPQTQELQLQFDYPYLLNLPFGLSLEGELYRRDTQFININYRAAATYRWQGASQLDVFWSRRQTNLLGFDEASVVARNRLPDTLDVGRSFFGLSLKRDETDQIFNPRRGYAFNVSMAAGSRKIKRNGKLLDLGLGSRYDSLSLNSAQYNLAADLSVYRPLFSGTVFYLGLKAGAFLSDEPLLANEQFRLGGAKLLRGFDEQQIFASAYGVLTSEVRLLLGRDAYVYVFGDFAYVNPRNQSKPQAKDDYPIGFGSGLSFNSRAGIFAVSLALGRRSGEVLDLGAPKVHFGYLSVF